MCLVQEEDASNEEGSTKPPDLDQQYERREDPSRCELSSSSHKYNDAETQEEL